VLDTAAHTSLAALVRGLVSDGVVSGVHDVATGGLAVAVSEMAVGSGIGVTVSAPGDDVFGEAPSRVVLSVPEPAVPEVQERARVRGVEVADLGVAGGDRITIGSAIDLPLAEATAAWRDRLPAALGAGVAQA
jgi:phosphoribosylformylglycinamidine synthase